MKNLDVKNLDMENPAVTREPTASEPDRVDANLEVWARELPDLDLVTEGIVQRIAKLDHHLNATMRETLDDFELSTGDYKLMMSPPVRRPAVPRQAGQARQVARSLDRCR